KAFHDSFKRWDKNNHLKNIQESGYFRYAREIVFSNKEDCTAERLIKLALSQGGLQNILNAKPELINGKIDEFSTVINELFGEREFELDFCYRMRLGVK
ncbi:MAG: class I SAM-dependent methyltransferase, partial [Eubacteriales bacterium]